MMNEFEQAKKEYEQIPVPEELADRVQRASARDVPNGCSVSGSAVQAPWPPVWCW